MNAIATRIQDAGFGRPRGLLGRIGGRLMARGNAATERRAVDEAALGPDDVALVVGPGPGIGLQAAGERCRLAIGIDPSPVMRRAAQRRCRALVAQGRVRVEAGVARLTGLPDAS
ncbi:MAG TPA: SAM-dependent methyltransferase, partial [Pseudonocardia sp.]|nr:SAM-dependent methyltransferase [Pseudonocardia sp.]